MALSNTCIALTAQNGVSPVYAASHEGHTDVVDILVKAGANIDQAYKTVWQICEQNVTDKQKLCIYHK